MTLVATFQDNGGCACLAGVTIILNWVDTLTGWQGFVCPNPNGLCQPGPQGNNVVCCTLSCDGTVVGVGCGLVTDCSLAGVGTCVAVDHPTETTNTCTPPMIVATQNPGTVKAGCCTGSYTVTIVPQ